MHITKQPLPNNQKIKSGRQVIKLFCNTCCWTISIIIRRNIYPFWYNKNWNFHTTKYHLVFYIFRRNYQSSHLITIVCPFFWIWFCFTTSCNTNIYWRHTFKFMWYTHLNPHKWYTLTNTIVTHKN